MKTIATLLLLVAPALSSPAIARPGIEYLGTPVEGRPFSTAVRAGDMLYLSGQIGIGANGTLPTTFDAQLRQAMDTIGGILKAQGLGWGDVVHCTVMLADMADWPAFNKNLRPLFHRPPLPRPKRVRSQRARLERQDRT